MINIKTEYIHESGDENINEDSFVIGKNIFGVFDGATSMTQFKNKKGYTGAYIASNICKKVFKNEKSSLYKLAITANREIRDQMERNKIDISKKENLWSTTIAVIKIDKKRNKFEWLQLGDSLIMVIYKDDTYKLMVNDYDHDIETLVMYKKLADKKIKNIRQVLDKQLLKTRRLANKTYGVLNGEVVVNKFFKKGVEKLDNIKNILLFTDGLILPKKDPKKLDDFDTFIKLYLSGGFKKIKDYIKQIQASDPNCWKYPRLKQCDDMTGISVFINNKTA
ncbi:MAG TPA: protein phosphatase 2C domain-containing protein [bacterium]|nr:protein phosphatase 2C domain-containing protein [bacterium]HOG38065.1 protein phosphatase 2C domain-containing protein [bacterium]HQI03121.1 protein phosphatase 2C domain-containing protein [bacterium]